MEKDQVNLRNMKFSALNVDFSSLSSNLLGSRRPVQAGIKEGYHLKSGCFTIIGSSSVKTVADREPRHSHAPYHK